MPYTLQELFQQGAHHTVESLIYVGRQAIQFIIDALNRRFGAGSVVKGPVLDELVSQVKASIQSAYQIPSATVPDPSTYGINPAIPQEFQYPVIGKLPDPLRPGETIDVPWTINSEKPLTNQEILDQAEKDLNEGYVRPDNYNSASYADLHRRDIKFQREVKERFGNDAPVDVEIIGAYRRG